MLSVAPGPVHTGWEARAGLQLKFATTPNVVACDALAALGRRTTVVPGTTAKLRGAALATLPRNVRSRMLGEVIRRMRTPPAGAG